MISFPCPAWEIRSCHLKLPDSINSLEITVQSFAETLIKLYNTLDTHHLTPPPSLSLSLSLSPSPSPSLSLARARRVVVAIATSYVEGYQSAPPPASPAVLPLPLHSFVRRFELESTCLHVDLKSFRRSGAQARKSDRRTKKSLRETSTRTRAHGHIHRFTGIRAPAHT